MACRIFGGLWLSAPLLLLAGSGGCGGNTVHIVGVIIYDGKPVPAGKIYFTPDASQQNTGPQWSAEIKDGRYDTKNGNGGSVLVYIEGFDGQATAERPMGSPVFTYQTKANLPRQNTNKDFDIQPAEAKRVILTGPSP